MYSITQAPKDVSASMPHRKPAPTQMPNNGGDGLNKTMGYGLPTPSGQYPHAVSQDGADSGSVHGGYSHGPGQGAC